MDDVQQYVAVIFTAQRTQDDDEGYAEMAGRMVRLAMAQPGFGGIESVRDERGLGITVSYWNTEADAIAWKQVSEHLEAQHLGRDRWYSSYRLRVATVSREYAFVAPAVDHRVTIAAVDPAHPDARFCVRQYQAELARRFPEGFDPGRSLALDDEAVRAPHGVFLLATIESLPVGCGSLKFHGDAPAELKRIWVASTTRGLGVGRRLLAALEDAAVAGGAPAVQLDTNGVLTEAITMYRSSGYVEVPPYNDEPYADLWFEKRLARRPT